MDELLTNIWNNRYHWTSYEAAFHKEVWDIKQSQDDLLSDQLKVLWEILNDIRSIYGGSIVKKNWL